MHGDQVSGLYIFVLVADDYVTLNQCLINLASNIFYALVICCVS